mgnify:FL=1
MANFKKKSRQNHDEARQNRHVSRHDRVGTQLLKEKPEDELIETIQSQTNPLILILDEVQDPRNLGAILRTADGAGVTAVVVPKNRAASLNDTVNRVSVGAAEHCNFFRVTNLKRAMEQIKAEGVWITGTSDQATASVYDLDFTGPTAIVMGSEESGIRRLTEETCDQLISLPMQGHVPCLNVSVATGVCLYEVVRQRLNS